MDWINEFLANLKYGELHSHTRGSDGYDMPETMAQRAAELGNDVHAMTEHGTCGVLMHHYDSCNSHGVLPIMGNELYVRMPEGWQTGDYQSRNSRSGRYHMTMLATSYAGYERLIRLNNAAHRNMEEVRKVKYPIATFDMLDEYAGDGLVVLTGCPSSIAFHDSMQHAEEYVDTLIRTFGKRNVFAEVMEHVLTRDDKTEYNCWDRPIQLADRFGIPIVWTNDVHAATQKHVEYLRSFTLAKKGYEFTAGWVRSKEEAFKICVSRIGEERAKEAFTSIDEIARRVEPMELEKDFVLPECDDVVEELLVELDAALERDVAENGEVIGGRNAREALGTELALFKKWDFLRFIAPQWDVCRFADSQGIMFNVRGSASGSYTLFLLGISKLHPLKYGLMWERFLCDKRLGKGDTPDIDVDIDTDRRHIVQDYARQRWGFEGVGTYLTFGHSSVVNVIAKVYEGKTGMEMDSHLVSDAKTYEPFEDENMNVIEPPEFKEWYSKAKWIKPMYDSLRGSFDTHGRHACAMAPLLEDVPVPIESWASEPVIAYSESSTLKTLQMLGLVKYDFLGLITMAILQALIDLTGERCPDVIADDDPCFSVFNEEKVDGIFQFDSRIGKMLIGEAAGTIQSIRNLADLTSLGRPGALDYVDTYFGPHTVEHPPEIQEIFNETNGVLIYQEQVARLYAVMTHNSMDSDALQDGIVALKELVPKHKKQAETEEFKAKYEKHRKAFIDGGERHGYDSDYAPALFESLKGYIRYGFNLSHALSYANLSAQMAWYKYNYPQQYWAVMLDSKRNSKYIDKTMQFVISALVESDIRFVPPHVNKADSHYTLSEDGKLIYAPISMVKGLGGKAVEQIVGERDKNGVYTLLEEFAERCPKIHSGQKQLMYEADMFDGVDGDVWKAGIAESKPYKLRGKLWTEEPPAELTRRELSIVDAHERYNTVKCLGGEVYQVMEDDDFLSEAFKKTIKAKKVAGWNDDHLKPGMTIVAYTWYDMTSNIHYILDYRRLAYHKPYTKPEDVNACMKAAIGFVVPENAKTLFDFAKGRVDKAIGYVSKIEERRTPKTTQQSITLQSGQRIWFCLEDRTKDRFLMKKTSHKNGDVPHIAVGDLVGATLATTFKDGEEMTYGQIATLTKLA